MNKPTLIVTDLDGTFVYDSKTVRQEDVKAIKEIQTTSTTAFATGRSVREIQYIEEQVGLHVDYYIAFNGALVQDKKGYVRLNKPMEQMTIRRMLDLFIMHNIIFDALDGVARWGNFQHEQADTLWGMNFMLLRAPYSILQTKQIYKINVRPEDGDSAHIVALLEEEVPEVHAYQTGRSRIEVVRRDVSKATGVLSCAAANQHIVSIGDAANDVEMFDISDMSYCMSRAPADIRDQAQKIVPYFSDAIYDFQKRDRKREQKTLMYF